MLATDSDLRPSVDGMRRIHWPASTGLRGHHVPDPVAAFARIMHLAEKAKIGEFHCHLKLNGNELLAAEMAIFILGVINLIRTKPTPVNQRLEAQVLSDVSQLARAQTDCWI